MIEQLIARVFHDRNVAHWNHWRAPTLAVHLELEEFYKDAIKALDALVEGYQGAFDLIGAIPAPKAESSDPAELLEETSNWIEDNHEGICHGNSAVANMLDTLAGVYLTTLYKLKHLK